MTDDIWQGRGIWAGWGLTTDHAASSYGQPVLVDPDGVAYGPRDIQGSQMVGQKEIAEMLGWSKQQVSNYYRDGRLPEPDSVIGGRPAWRRKVIEDYKGNRLGEG